MICLFILYFATKLILGTILSSICKFLCSSSDEDHEQAKRGMNVEYCMRVPKDTIADERKLFEVNKLKSTMLDQMSLKLYRKRGLLYLAAMKQAESNDDRILKVDGKRVKQFTTLPSYNYQLHPDMRDLFID